MNQNYIAPEALDDRNQPTCPHCKNQFVHIEDKIKFYQGICPHCDMNPSALAVANSKKEQDRIGIRLGTSSYRNHFWTTIADNRPKGKPISIEEDFF